MLSDAEFLEQFDAGTLDLRTFDHEAHFRAAWLCLRSARFKDAVGRLAADFLEDREAARKELEAAGPAAEKALVEALEHPDHRVRRVSLDLLAGLKAKSALPAARRLYKSDEDDATVDSAFRLLRALGADAEDAPRGQV